MGISSNKIVLSFSFDFWGILEKKVTSIVALEDFPRFSNSSRKIWLILKIRDLEIPERRKSLALTRDLFLFAC